MSVWPSWQKVYMNFNPSLLFQCCASYLLLSTLTYFLWLPCRIQLEKPSVEDKTEPAIMLLNPSLVITNTLLQPEASDITFTRRLPEDKHARSTLQYAVTMSRHDTIFVHDHIITDPSSTELLHPHTRAHTPFFHHTQTGLQGSRPPSSIQPGPPCARLWTRHTCFHSAAAALKSTCGGLFLQRPGLRCPNFPLYTQIICAWVMQTEGSSKCMWTPLMAPSNWSWNWAVGSGMAAVKICTIAISQRDYTGLQGLFHDSGVIGMGVIHSYDVYISSLSAGFGMSCLHLFIS